MKKLTKSPNKMISGVCAGVAEYFNVDPTLVRALWLLLTFAGGSGILLYLICTVLLPAYQPVVIQTVQTQQTQPEPR